MTLCHGHFRLRRDVRDGLEALCSISIKLHIVATAPPLQSLDGLRPASTCDEALAAISERMHAGLHDARRNSLDAHLRREMKVRRQTCQKRQQLSWCLGIVSFCLHELLHGAVTVLRAKHNNPILVERRHRRTAPETLFRCQVNALHRRSCQVHPRA